MKAWTLTAATLAATLTACLDEPASIDPDVAEDAAPGDPAVYAPDGWPLQIGEATTQKQRLRLHEEFLSYGGITGIHLVGDQVYGAEFGYGAEYGRTGGSAVYLGHFPEKALWDRGTVEERESVLPERFRGKIEYLPPAWFVRFDETTGEPYVIEDYLKLRGSREAIREGRRYHEERMRREESIRR